MPSSNMPVFALALLLVPMLVLAPVLMYALALRDAAWHAPWTLNTPSVYLWLQLCALMPLTSALKLVCRDIVLKFCISFMLDLCNSWLSSEARVGALHFLLDLYSSCLSSTACVGALHFMLDLCSLYSLCLSSAVGARVLHLMVDFSSLCLSLSARNSCSSRDFVARYCRTPRGLLGAACIYSLPSTDGEHEAVADVHGVFTGKFFAPLNGSGAALLLPKCRAWRMLVATKLGDFVGDYFVAAKLGGCFVAAIKLELVFSR
ncbi:hypothetical protein SLEP1_g13782 [Rubroshorea leprosula]|uniref:Uncharacterized protein n=1 Tax=Rubroshorea leprosula TaxID=152421 RepID=A0AAV5IR33_9ROSI|nr:hypothetical protein SLEP1_g13782 [Rubroshorea leprosula]